MTADASEPAVKPNALRRHWLAFLVLALLLLPSATLVPMGTNGQLYAWYLADYPVGGERVQVVGSTEFVGQLYGLPAGTFQYGSNTSSARHGPQGKEIDVPVDKAMETSVRQQFPEAFGPEGWSLNLEGVFPPPPITVILIYVLSCVWWIALRGWSWRVEEPLKRNLLQVLLLSFWPWLILTSCGLTLLDRRAAAQLGGSVVDPEVSIAGTALLVSAGAVFALTRSASGVEQAAESSSPPQA